MAVAPLPKLRRPATHDRLMAKPRPWRIINVCMDQEIVNRLDLAERDLAEAELRANKTNASADDREAVNDAHAARDLARAEFDANADELLFVSIGSKAYDALVEKHPQPQDDKPKNGKAPATGDKPDGDPVYLHVALVAASLADPQTTVEQAQHYSDEWNGAEYARLYMAAIEVNGQSGMFRVGASSGVRE